VELRRLGLAAALVAAAGFLAPAVASAQSATVPDFTKLGFSMVAASTNLAAGAGGSLHFGSIAMQIPQGTFTDPVTFELLQGPVSNFQSAAPSGETVVTDFALRVVDTKTQQPVATFLKPVMVTITQSDISSASMYANVTQAGQIMANPVAASISGDVLTHPITADLVGWVVLSPSSSVPAVPDFTQHGFPTVVASTDLAAGAAGSVQFGGISINIPQGAFTQAVKFQLLQGPVMNLQSAAPTGQTVVTDFALRVIDPSTGQLIGTFLKPVTATVTESDISSASMYANVTPSGQIMMNPMAATIRGDVLTHPIAAAAVGWAVLSPTSAVPMVPDFTQHGFPHVVASADLAAGAAGSVQYGGISVKIPQGAFPQAVKFELLQGSASTFQATAPAGETVVSNFALRVVDSATGQLIGTFSKPVTVTVSQSGIDSASTYDNVTAAGQIMPNPIPAKISGDVLTHPIPAAMVGWVVLSRAATVRGATSPTTGIPILPLVGSGALLIAAGVLLVRYARAHA